MKIKAELRGCTATFYKEWEYSGKHRVDVRRNDHHVLITVDHLVHSKAIDKPEMQPHLATVKEIIIPYRNLCYLEIDHIKDPE